MRYLGLDYGEKTVGVALSDALLLTAQPYETIFRKEENKLRRTFARIEEICREQEVGRIVLGLPLSMDGSDSQTTVKARAFKEVLERRTGLPVILQDERLTSVAAEEILREMAVPAAERKAYIDKIAAAVILRDYMNEQERRGADRAENTQTRKDDTAAAGSTGKGE